MFLKSLTIKGFKSFADSTTLTLEPGVTVVVGPNGSGKSNVVDAIAWVLGAQAPSAVRSQKMDDVIFAGTAKRPALGRAEVSLTLDNSSGLLPIEFSEVTITRILFRTGDSEYAINGVPCRLLDVTELLSDSGVGRQQHVIVSQGQIDAVLNARPEDRRSIIEEAAGVLKFRKRKERSERRLEATEANLARIGDLLREVRRQLRPLEKQAEAARRHGEVMGELSALRLHLAGRELTSLRTRLETGARARADLVAQEGELKGRLAGLDAEVIDTEAQLSAAGASDIGDVLRHAESLRERARGLSAVLTERRRSLERDRGSLLDTSLLASLEADATRFGGELEQVEEAAISLGPEADDLAVAQANLERERVELADIESAAVASGAAPASAAAEVRGELSAVRNALARTEGELERARRKMDGLAERITAAEAEIVRFQDECAAAQSAEEPLVSAGDAAASAREAAAAEVARLEAQRSGLVAEASAATARAEALLSALDAARARAGAERLAGHAGVLGTLADLVVIEAGYELAFDAAAGDAAGAVVMADAATARDALAALAAVATPGAVVPVGVGTAAATPAAGRPLRDVVRGRSPEADRLVARLVGGVVVVEGDWSSAVDVALAHPDAVVVTTAGDRFGPSGWRLGAADAGVTADAAEQARAAADVADAAVAANTEELARARATLAAANERERQAVAALDAHDAGFSAATDGLGRARNRLVAATTERDSLDEQLTQLEERAMRDRPRVAELEAILPELESAESADAASKRAALAARNRFAERASAVAALQRDLEVRAAGLEERRNFLQRRLAEIEVRLAADAEERVAAEGRRERIERALAAVDRLAAMVGDHHGVVQAHLTELYAERERQSASARAITERLERLRRDRTAAERQLDELRERARRAELDEAEVKLRLESTVEMVRRELDVEPEVAMATECPPLAEGVSAPARARELERELKLMGPINPLALEEFTALNERHSFLETQLDDVRTSRRELTKVISAIDAEIRSVFSAAYADVAANFERLFGSLFPGGTGRLVLTAPEDLLATGIEVEAKPSGKNVKKLSLLSGGERSLTALAFLFAVFRSRPSPFYVMDEVEAALDDVNLHRFLGLVEEFRNEAQLLIVSHQKRTMEAADCLFGVTMAPGGSSKVVSETVRTA